MMKKVSEKEIRNFVSSRAKGERMMMALDELLSRTTDLGRNVADQERQLQRLSEEANAASKNRDAAKSEAALVLLRAKDEAKKIRADAEQAIRNAHEEQDQASVLVDAAKAEAHDLVAAAKDEVLRLEQAGEARSRDLTKRENAVAAREEAVVRSEQAAEEKHKKYDMELARIREFAKGVA